MMSGKYRADAERLVELLTAELPPSKPEHQVLAPVLDALDSTAVTLPGRAGTPSAATKSCDRRCQPTPVTTQRMGYSSAEVGAPNAWTSRCARLHAEAP